MRTVALLLSVSVVAATVGRAAVPDLSSYEPVELLVRVGDGPWQLDAEGRVFAIQLTGEPGSWVGVIAKVELDPNDATTQANHDFIVGVNAAYPWTAPSFAPVTAVWGGWILDSTYPYVRVDTTRASALLDAMTNDSSRPYSQPLLAITGDGGIPRDWDVDCDSWVLHDGSAGKPQIQRTWEARLLPSTSMNSTLFDAENVMDSVIILTAGLSELQAFCTDDDYGLSQIAGMGIPMKIIVQPINLGPVDPMPADNDEDTLDPVDFDFGDLLVQTGPTASISFDVGIPLPNGGDDYWKNDAIAIKPVVADRGPLGIHAMLPIQNMVGPIFVSIKHEETTYFLPGVIVGAQLIAVDVTSFVSSGDEIQVAKIKSPLGSIDLSSSGWGALVVP